MGLPAGNEVAPERPIRVNEELVWDNGTPFPGDLRRPPRAPTSARFFAALGLAAVVSAKMPHAPKVYPYDNLTVELGGWS
ncbi:NADH dehydrogenase [ubiquinone] 1 beta subcomplex subunit 8, mitochondrial isoform X2 [Brachypodium distachyon]|uniref:NADH dehydrogenase [ubiquinone] 1 beta subcomplex subunit 8, mitochondrial isoform X2 n=1 Tax=Brachypodium distachyon TaxID=15368 RepID=UPI00071C95CF|nr:NADH dehydrogenase [ubiquinone] 1 beta subcomplex subunit 8, mitochondrial isoform X2 [Brachypodium distachyon]|eukprot:XP_014752233.1 NADH dehydrogenase [ubiquinone] 1 beta subcomplex subunit 8, mitochondrial isoform X2 [Brachypodium distachyon]